MKRAIALISLLLVAVPTAMAQGFAVRDFSVLKLDSTGLSQGEYIMRAEPERVTIACDDCAGLVAVDLQLGASNDGTEQRYRAGTTTIESLQEQCQAKAPNCTLTAAQVGGAVGWTSQYEIGNLFGSTTQLFKNGDLLTIRSLAGDKAQAFDNGQAILKTLGSTIVGD